MSVFSMVEATSWPHSCTFLLLSQERRSVRELLDRRTFDLLKVRSVCESVFMIYVVLCRVCHSDIQQSTGCNVQGVMQDAMYMVYGEQCKGVMCRVKSAGCKMQRAGWSPTTSISQCRVSVSSGGGLQDLLQPWWETGSLLVPDPAAYWVKDPHPSSGSWSCSILGQGSSSFIFFLLFFLFYFLFLCLFLFTFFSFLTLILIPGVPATALSCDRISPAAKCLYSSGSPEVLKLMSVFSLQWFTKHAVQCSEVQWSAVQCSEVQCSTVQCTSVQFIVLQCIIPQPAPDWGDLGSLTCRLEDREDRVEVVEIQLAR